MTNNLFDYNIFQFGEKNYSYTVVEVRFHIELKRKPFYYVMNVIIPTVVLALLSTLTFLIPADSGEKLSMGVSVLLAFTVFMLILSDNTPQTSDNPPLLGKNELTVSPLNSFKETSNRWLGTRLQ